MDGIGHRPLGGNPTLDPFRDELLGRESPETVRFPMRTAPLDQMSGALCDHVLGHSGSASRLATAAWNAGSETISSSSRAPSGSPCAFELLALFGEP